MKKIIVLLFLTVLLSLQSQAQTLYVPRNVKAAFEKGTRAMDGKPGPHYWQNHSNYTIDLAVAPPNRMIKGSEQITYFNDSPDTLKMIVFRFTMNYHKPETGRAGGHGSNLDSTQFTSGLHIDHFEINGKTTGWPELSDDYTWVDVPLSGSLLPHDSIHFIVRWHYEIAPEFVGNSQALREGMIDPTTWCVAYFYPCVAVYDDYNGWDRLPFTGAQEFYNDFSNYTLKVHAPKNFMVWATGTLQNPDQVLQPHYAQLLKESMASDKLIHIATPADLERKNITKQNPVNTWIWRAHDVTEAVLFISNHDDWDASSVVVDDSTGRRTSVQAAYYDTSADFHQAVAIGQKTLSWYSLNLPGVPYPYPKMTVVEGFAGMEYPMIVNDGSSGTDTRSWNDFKDEQNHEISHTYFPFYMGINESRYAFMDEGWATTFTILMAREEHRYPNIAKKGANYIVNDLSDEEQLPMIESNYQTGLPYLNNAYFKPGRAYLALKDLLGDGLFKKCLQGYIARWHGKHPIPWDFFNSFNDNSGKNLNWFWNSWFFSHGYDDIGVAKVLKINHGYAVTVKNVGGFDIPFELKINYADGSKSDMHETPVIWKKDEKQTIIPIKTEKKIRSLTLDTGIWMDANEKDNEWKAENGSPKQPL